MCEQTLPLCEPPPCNPSAEAALQPLSWCFGSLSICQRVLLLWRNIFFTLARTPVEIFRGSLLGALCLYVCFMSCRHFLRCFHLFLRGPLTIPMTDYVTLTVMRIPACVYIYIYIYIYKGAFAYTRTHHTCYGRWNAFCIESHTPFRILACLYLLCMLAVGLAILNEVCKVARCISCIVFSAYAIFCLGGRSLEIWRFDQSRFFFSRGEIPPNIGKSLNFSTRDSYHVNAYHLKRP